MNEQHFFELLSKIPYLSILPIEQKRDLFGAARKRLFDAHEMIFMEGDAATGLWLIEGGQVKIAKLNPDGDEYILHLLSTGDSFNDIAVLERGNNPAYAIALTEVTCWMIPVDIIQQLLADHPEAAEAAIVMLTTRVRTLVQPLEDLALYSVTARLARFLIQQAESPIVEGGVTRVAIAAHLATTPETISRALRSLERAEAIQFNRHQIEIINSDILRALAFFELS